LIPQRLFDDPRILKGKGRRAFLEHGQKPVDLIGFDGKPDIPAGRLVLYRPTRVDDEFAVGVKEGEERDAPLGAAQLEKDLISIRTVELGFTAKLLAHREPRHHEMLGDDGIDLRACEEGIEFPAQPTPRSPENQKDVLVLFGSLRAGLREWKWRTAAQPSVQDSLGARRDSNTNGKWRGEVAATKTSAHGQKSPDRGYQLGWLPC
jgi:hypothetical protein